MSNVERCSGFVAPERLALVLCVCEIQFQDSLRTPADPAVRLHVAAGALCPSSSGAFSYMIMFLKDLKNNYSVKVFFYSVKIGNVSNTAVCYNCIV